MRYVDVAKGPVFLSLVLLPRQTKEAAPSLCASSLFLPGQLLCNCNLTKKLWESVVNLGLHLQMAGV